MPFATINGRELYYVWRQADKPSLTLLLVHGLGSSSSFYAPIIPGLVASGFSCLAFDTYGSCQSRYTGEAQSIKSIASDAASLLSSLGIPPASVIAVGHSMGGMVVGELAVKEPFAGAVLVGAVNPSPAVAEVFAKRIDAVKKEGMELMADTIPASALGSRSTPTQRAFVRALLLSQSREGYTSLCQAIADAVLPDYPQIRAPLLVIGGEEDKTAPLEGLRKIYNSWGSEDSAKQFETLPGVGHWHCIEDANEVGGLIEKFAKKVAAKEQV